MEKLNLESTNNEHKEKLEQLGSIELAAKLESSANDKNMGENLTVFTFLKNIYEPESFFGVKENGEEEDDYKRSVEISDLVNNLTDKDIENVLKYIDSLNNDDITDQRRTHKDQVYHVLPIMDGKQNLSDVEQALKLKKESLILELMNLGVNPFKIKRCLQNESNKNEFKSLSWNHICEHALSFKKEIQDRHMALTGRYIVSDPSHWDIPLLFLNYMYLIETFKSQNANDEIINLCYKNISDSKYIYSSYEDVMIPFFLIKYLEYEFGNQEDKNPTENLLKQKNKIFVEILMGKDVSTSIYIMRSNPAGAKKMLLEQKTNDKNVGLLLYNINKSDYKFDGFYRFMIPKFWEIIDGLPEECIFVFVVEMMREVTLTRQQLDLVKGKVQNETLRLYLEKFNYDMEHKRYKSNMISEGTKISWANYLCEKLFRGIGYLIAIILITAVHAVILALLMLLPFNWYICLLYIVLGAHFVGSIISGVMNDYYFAPIFKKCIHFMQWAYDKTVGHWMQIWALHYPVNNIPEPENKIYVPLNMASGAIGAIEPDKINENENISLQTKKTNNTNHEDYIANNGNNN